ncbi:PHP domain-containing protein [Phascolarctobacterium faecium]|nr:PHP domain-containing protein [Phascolarctobacterium faecium]MDM8109324.1 PHP domain-containing protein [Phascolarctobacterium faecium]
MKTLLADFHIHTLLSPCAEIEMTPHHIVMRAAQYGVDAVAITDHNASANAAAAVEAAKNYGVKVFPGMEVECREEAHIVVLFDTLEQLAAWQKIVDSNMSGLKNNAERFGAQFIVDDDDNFIAEEERMLLGPLKLPAAEVIQKVNAMGGMAIAAHVDRPSYSLLMQLGFLPSDMGLAAAEISHAGIRELKEQKLKLALGGLNYVTDSDAHMMDSFINGPKNLITVKSLTVAELKLALAAEDGRSWQPGCFLENHDY